MKLLLTSEGLFNKKIKDEFLRLVNKPVDEVKMAFIPTAANVEDGDLEWVQSVRDSIKEIGVNDVVDVDISRTVGNDLERVLGNKNVIFVNGGNTFYLLYHIRKSGFGEYLMGYLEKGGFYVGASAGSIVMGKSIKVCDVKDYDDSSVVEMDDYSGLGLVDFDIFTHYVSKWDERIEDYKLSSGRRVVTLDDDQAIVVENGNVKVVSG